MSPFEGLITNTADATRGGLAAVKKVEGVLQDGQMIPGFKDEKTGETGIRVKVTLAEAIILEMDPGVPEPDLKDDTYSVFYNYGKQGTVKANVKSFYTKGFLKSAQELAAARGKPTGTVVDLIGTRVTMERRKIVLFKMPDENGVLQERTGEGFVFLPDGAGNSVKIEEHVKSLIVNQKPAVAVRLLMGDNRTKYEPKWKDAVSAGTMGDLVGFELKDGIFVAKVK